MANGILYGRSVFAKYFDQDDASVLAWANNVLAKLSAKGGVAEFVLREDDAGDTDFDDVFLPGAIFFAYLVELARHFEDFTTDDFLSDRYLNNHGQFTGGEETLVQLVYAIKNSLRIRGQRGTNNTIAISTDVSIPNGEILRLIDWSTFIFFKLGAARSKNNSWNLNNASPNFRGCTGRYDLNIGYEYTEDVEDLSKYPLLNSNSVFLTTYWGKNALEIEAVANDVVGIGANQSAKRIVVDPRFNYEITFYVAQDITLNNITFGCLAFDDIGDQIPLSNIVNGQDSNVFFDDGKLNKAGKYYFVRGVIFNKDKAVVSQADATLNIGYGRNLKMNQNVVSIIPYIVLDSDAAGSPDDPGHGLPGEDSAEIQSNGSISTAVSGSSSTDVAYDGSPSIFLWNIKVTPCDLKYERCYLNNKNFVDIIMDNKNGKYSNVQIENILRKFFIPYNTAFKVTHLGDLGEVIPETSLLLLEDNSGYILLEDSNRIQLE